MIQGGSGHSRYLLAMKRTTATLVTIATAAFLVGPGAARAAGDEVPEWARPAVRYLSDHGYLDRTAFSPNAPMARADFKQLMVDAFGGGYGRDRGLVTAGEVSAALVRKLGRRAVADRLTEARSPDGWTPEPHKWFGSEVVARELGLRHDRPTVEEENEAFATQPMLQADIAWAVWKAKTAPSTWNVDILETFELAQYDDTRRGVVKFALSLTGAPYVWGGEWPSRTRDGYPYGAQEAGGFDCSGFAWYVLRSATDTWKPIGRSYEGWDLPERSSAQMAAATERRLSYEKLLPADLVFFAPNGTDSKAEDVYHAGIYLGRGWIVHSSGSRAGISLAFIGPGSWWEDQYAWGRRIIPA